MHALFTFFLTKTCPGRSHGGGKKVLRKIQTRGLPSNLSHCNSETHRYGAIPISLPICKTCKISASLVPRWGGRGGLGHRNTHVGSPTELCFPPRCLLLKPRRGRHLALVLFKRPGEHPKTSQIRDDIGVHQDLGFLKHRNISGGDTVNSDQ